MKNPNLIPKKVTRKDGKTTTVWVRPNKKTMKKVRKKVLSDPLKTLEGKLTYPLLRAIQGGSAYVAFRHFEAKRKELERKGELNDREEIKTLQEMKRQEAEAKARYEEQLKQAANQKLKKGFGNLALVNLPKGVKNPELVSDIINFDPVGHPASSLSKRQKTALYLKGYYATPSVKKGCVDLLDRSTNNVKFTNIPITRLSNIK